MVQFNSYTLPWVDDVMDHLGNIFISTLNLIKGYWQVTLTPKTQPKTALFTTSGQWQYQVILFGLHWKPATFQQLIDIVLWPYCYYVPTYLDVIIHPSTWAKHFHSSEKYYKHSRKLG